MASVYAIKSNQTDKCYIGSTTKTLEERLSKHKKCYKEWLQNNDNYISSYEILKFDDAYIEIIEECEINVRFEREAYYIKLHRNNTVNINIPNRDLKEYERMRSIKNKDEIKIYQAEYREKNKEKLKEYDKEKYERNKEKIKAQSKARYEANKEEINAKRRKQK